MSGWEDDSYCIACGRENPIGMKLDFVLTDDGIETSYVFPKVFQGYKDTVHGGMVALLLDEIMVNLPLRKDKIPAVSADIKVKLKKPLAVGDEVLARAKYLKTRSRFFIIKGEVIRKKDNELIAESEALCVRVEGKGLKL